MQLSSKKMALTKENGFDLKTTIKNLSLFFLLFCVSCVVFSLIFSLVFYYTENPSKMISFSSHASLFLSSFIISFIMSKKIGQRYLLYALLLSALILITLLIGAIFTDTKIFSIEFLIKLLTIVFCIAGSFLGKKRKRNHTKRRIR